MLSGSGTFSGIGIGGSTLEIFKGVDLLQLRRYGPLYLGSSWSVEKNMASCISECRHIRFNAINWLSLSRYLEGHWGTS